MKDDRQIRIVQFLLDRSDYVSSQELADFFSVSKRTIIMDMSDLCGFLGKYGINIMSKKHFGYRAMISNSEKYKLFENDYLIIHKRNTYIENENSYRLRHLRAVLCMSYDYHKIDDLADILYINSSTIYSYLKNIKNYAAPRSNLIYESLTKKGVRLKGDEFYRRYQMIHNNVIIDFINLKISAFKEFEHYFSKIDIQKLKDYLIYILEKYKLSLSDYHIAFLCFYLSLTYVRVEEGFHCHIDDIDFSEYNDFPEYQAAVEIVRWLFGQNIQELENEARAVFIVLVLNNDGMYTDNICSIYGKHYVEAEQLFYRINTDLVMCIGIDFNSIKMTKETMINCLIRVLFFIKFNLSKITIQAIGVRGYFPRFVQDPVICELARIAARTIENSLGTRIMSYVCNLISLMFESVMTLITNDEKLSVALLVGEGKCYSEGIQNYIIRNFSTYISKIDCYNHFTFNKDEKNYDVVLTSTSRKMLGEDVVRFIKIPFFIEENCFSVNSRINNAFSMILSKKQFSYLDIHLTAKYYQNRAFINKKFLIEQIYYDFSKDYDDLQRLIALFEKMDKAKKYNPLGNVLFILNFDFSDNDQITIVKFDKEYKWYEYNINYVVHIAYNPRGNVLALKLMHLFCYNLSKNTDLIDEIIKKNDTDFNLVDWYKRSIDNLFDITNSVKSSSE